MDMYAADEIQATRRNLEPAWSKKEEPVYLAHTLVVMDYMNLWNFIDPFGALFWSLSGTDCWTQIDSFSHMQKRLDFIVVAFESSGSQLYKAIIIKSNRFRMCENESIWIQQPVPKSV